MVLSPRALPRVVRDPLISTITMKSMKTSIRQTLHLGVVALATFSTSLAGAYGKPLPLGEATLKGDQSIATPYGAVELQDNYPTDASSKLLFDAMDAQRAAQAYIWSTPIVSFVRFRDVQNKDYGPNARGTFAVFESFEEKEGILTANLTTPYILGWDNLAAGPIVIEYPPGKTAGGVLDMWQRPVTDLGLTGPDEGKGAKYLIVGPEDDPKKYQEPGTHVFQSVTNNIMIGLRLLESEPGFEENFKKSLKISALGGKPAEVRFLKGINKAWSATAPVGIAYWRLLQEIINDEPVREQDKAWMALIEPLGIRKGGKFEPDERQTKLLTDGAILGELMTRNLQVNPRYTQPYWAGTQWYKSFDFPISQEDAHKVFIDERATWFYEAVTSTKGMVDPEPGKGQVYMTTKRDKNGDLLRADRTYRLRVPKDVPVGQFWALTLYSEDTRRAYPNGQDTLRSANLDSRSKDLKRNADGSVDLYIGPKAPKGFETNWMQSVGDDGWFVYFRLYAPLEPFFDKTFSLTDFTIVE